MCNSCDCENSDKCSIVGSNNSPGFCCVMCVGYNEQLTCLKSKFVYTNFVPEKLIKEKTVEKNLIIPNE
jgi:hypothetical protein